MNMNQSLRWSIISIAFLITLIISTHLFFFMRPYKRGNSSVNIWNAPASIVQPNSPNGTKLSVQSSFLERSDLLLEAKLSIRWADTGATLTQSEAAVVADVIKHSDLAHRYKALPGYDTLNVDYVDTGNHIRIIFKSFLVALPIALLCAAVVHRVLNPK